MARANKGSVEQITGFNQTGPNLISDGPTGVGARPDLPRRSLVRMADPRIEDALIPARVKGVDAVNGKPRLMGAENGTGRQ